MYRTHGMSYLGPYDAVCGGHRQAVDGAKRQDEGDGELRTEACMHACVACM